MHQGMPNGQMVNGPMGNGPMGNVPMGNGPMGHNPNCGPGQGPGGGPMQHQTMYNSVPHNSMMDPAMVRMRAQSRYRLGTPNPNSMRPGMPGMGGSVMPGQNSPMGGGMPQSQVMSNQNMRQQVSTLLKLKLITEKSEYQTFNSLVFNVELICSKK